MTILRKTTKEDIEDHNTVVAIIKKNNKYLVLDHIKGDMLTFPVGKCLKDETPEKGLKRELEEELDIIPTKFSLEHDYKTIFEFKPGIKTRVHLYLYSIKQYSGTIKNKEPKKHKKLMWLTLDKLRDSNRRIGDATLKYLELKNK